MRRAALIINPRAGRQRDPPETVRAIIAILREGGIEANAIETTGPGTAGAIAASEAASGSEIVFACGGDGTVHEVLQGLVGTNVALGVIPLGTANALARSLGLSLNPLNAARQYGASETVRIAVGEVSCGRGCESHGPGAAGAQQSRFFTLMAGAGPDGALVYSLRTAQKLAMGRAAYYAHAARLFLTRYFPAFRVCYRLAGSASWRETMAVSVLSARIGNLGGVFGRLTPGSSIHADTLRMYLVRPPGAVALPAWFAFGQAGLHRFNPWLRVCDVEEYRCQALHSAAAIHVQADGEWIGALPISVGLRRDALSLLVPKMRSTDTIGNEMAT